MIIQWAALAFLLLFFGFAVYKMFFKKRSLKNSSDYSFSATKTGVMQPGQGSIKDWIEHQQDVFEKEKKLRETAPTIIINDNKNE